MKPYVIINDLSNTAKILDAARTLPHGRSIMLPSTASLYFLYQVINVLGEGRVFVLAENTTLENACQIARIMPYQRVLALNKALALKVKIATVKALSAKQAILLDGDDSEEHNVAIAKQLPIGRQLYLPPKSSPRLVMETFFAITPGVIFQLPPVSGREMIEIVRQARPGTILTFPSDIPLSIAEAAAHALPSECTFHMPSMLSLDIFMAIEKITTADKESRKKMATDRLVEAADAISAMQELASGETLQTSKSGNSSSSSSATILATLCTNSIFEEIGFFTPVHEHAEANPSSNLTAPHSLECQFTHDEIPFLTTFPPLSTTASAIPSSSNASTFLPAPPPLQRTFTAEEVSFLDSINQLNGSSSMPATLPPSAPFERSYSHQKEKAGVSSSHVHSCPTTPFKMINLSDHKPSCTASPVSPHYGLHWTEEDDLAYKHISFPVVPELSFLGTKNEMKRSSAEAFVPSSSAPINPNTLMQIDFNNRRASEPVRCASVPVDKLAALNRNVFFSSGNSALPTKTYTGPSSDKKKREEFLTNKKARF